MKKIIIFVISFVLLLLIGGYFALNIWLYGGPTPCFGKKTDWTQAEIEDHFMRRTYGSAKSSGYVTYEDFIDHPGTVTIFWDRKSRSQHPILKGRYTLTAWYEVLDGENAGMIEERNESFSKCLRRRGYFGDDFDPEKNEFKSPKYKNLVQKKANSK